MVGIIHLGRLLSDKLSLLFVPVLTELLQFWLEQLQGAHNTSALSPTTSQDGCMDGLPTRQRHPLWFHLIYL